MSRKVLICTARPNPLPPRHQPRLKPKVKAKASTPSPRKRRRKRRPRNSHHPRRQTPNPEPNPPMPDLQDGESTEMQGSGAKPYILKNTGGVYSCSCPAWRNQSIAIEQRTCKH